MVDHEIESPDRPSKRQKLSPDESAALDAAMADAPATTGPAKSNLVEQSDREKRFGIAAYVNKSIPGFAGILKQRYVDFMVHEILPDGRVCHLVDDVGMTAKGGSASEQKPDQAEAGAEKDQSEISPENLEKLRKIFGEKTTERTLTLYKLVLENPDRKASGFKPTWSDPIENKMDRQAAHEVIRDVFEGQLVTSTQDQNVIKISAKGKGHPGNGERRNNPRWEDIGGEYLHFTLYKENKDTMELINHLSAQLKTTNKKFGFAGTKDRRAVTVQRVSVKRVSRDQLAHPARGLFNARIGSLEYKPRQLSLGDHGGNQFTITLRDCHFEGEAGLTVAQRANLAKDILAKSTSALHEEGFINYFGLQRFGTYEASTDSIGKKLLSGKFEEAIDLVLSYSAEALAAAQDPNSTARISEDDKRRALGLHKWKTEGNSDEALRIMPNRFQGEKGMIKHLGFVNKKTGQQNNRDFIGALGTLPKTLRGMYLHAYQSVVWNTVASERWDRYGAVVIPGDLVLVHEHKDKEIKKAEEELEEVDADGEVVINPQGFNAATTADDFERARALTAEEAASGKYSIFDIVLPQPGWDVEYPPNDIGKFYKEFMMDPARGGGINPHDMRRKWRDLSLPGGYRKLMAKPFKQVEFEVKTYKSDEEELVETDLMKLVKEGKSVTFDETKKLMKFNYHTEKPAATNQEAKVEEEKVAAILKFQLGSSMYATMALRELMKGGTEAYKPDFTR